MAHLTKSVYTCQSLRKVALDIQLVYAPFEPDDFLKAVLSAPWDHLEVKERIQKIGECLGKYLPEDYGLAIGVIDQVIMHSGAWPDNFCGFFPAFVEIYGQDDVNWDISVPALARYTIYASSEIAVRPFIIKNQERMMAQMYQWAKHENECVRRLASEGCRPEMPWGQVLSSFQKDPSPLLPILTQLKADPSVYVRKSVANNLNDISKTHPDLVAELAREWYGERAEVDWVIKHGCRTLMKQGRRDVLALFGYDDLDSIELDHFALKKVSARIGGNIAFSFSLHANSDVKTRIEYAVDYVKKNGRINRKVFLISEIRLNKNQRKHYTKDHPFVDLRTRRHYPGTHSIVLLINGVERGKLDFELTADAEPMKRTSK